MKKSILLFLTLLSVHSILLFAQAPENSAKVIAARACSDFHKTSCLRLPDEGFTYNAQSHSGFFVKGQSSIVKAIFFKGMEYHVSVCTEDKSRTNFVIKDVKTGEILYNNAKDNYVEEIQLSNENTRSVKIEITLVGKKEQEGMCAGILIEHRKSDGTF